MDERKLIDDNLRKLEGLISSHVFGDPIHAKYAQLAMHLGEALMRAHRELDDDVWHVKEHLERHGSDLAAAMGSPDDSGDVFESGVPAGVGDGGTFLTERDLVDRALEKARYERDALGDFWGTLAYTLVELNVHQIRELDDTISHLMEAVSTHGAKVITAIPEFRESLKPPPPPEKKGLFS